MAAPVSPAHLDMDGTDDGDLSISNDTDRNTGTASAPLRIILGWGTEFIAHVTGPLSRILDQARRFFDRRERQLQQLMADIDRRQEAFNAIIEDGRAKLGQLVEEVDAKQAGLSAAQALDVSWVCTMTGGNAFCDVCSEYVDRLPAGAVSGMARRSPWIKRNGGIAPDRGDFKRAAVGNEDRNGHLQTQLHAQCVAAREEAEKLMSLPDAYDLLSEREQETMQRLWKVLHHQVDKKRSIRDYEHIVHLLDECDADMGDREHSRETLSKMVALLRHYGRLELTCFFSTVNPLTNSKPRTGLAADKMTDLGHVQSEVVNARFNYNGTPITVCIDVKEIDDSYDGTQGEGVEVKQAGGFACFNKIVEACEEHGILLFKEKRAADGSVAYDQNGNVDYESVLDENDQNEQISCFTADGEAVYQSENVGVNHHFHSKEDGLGDQTILTHHDPPHALDLLKADAQSAYVAEQHTTIKAIFSHFSTSPKRNRKLWNLVEKYEADFMNLHYLFEVR